MSKNARRFATLVAAGALFAVPATGIAAKGGNSGDKPDSSAGKSSERGNGQSENRGRGSDRSSSRSKRCKRPEVRRSFVVHGKLVSITPDNPATTEANEAEIKIEVRSANRAARASGELADQNDDRKGVQIRGAEYTISGTDEFELKLRGYEGDDTPSAGDFVRVKGRVMLTRKRCAEDGTSTADRIGTPDIRKVTIHDRDKDAD